MKLKTPLVLVATLVFTGCTGLGVVRDEALKRGQSAIDEANQTALWQLCEGSTLGGYNRLPDPIREALVRLCDARVTLWERPANGG